MPAPKNVGFWSGERGVKSRGVLPGLPAVGQLLTDGVFEVTLETERTLDQWRAQTGWDVAPIPTDQQP